MCRGICFYFFTRLFWRGLSRWLEPALKLWNSIRPVSGCPIESSIGAIFVELLRVGPWLFRPITLGIDVSHVFKSLFEEQFLVKVPLLKLSYAFLAFKDLVSSAFSV